MSVARRVAVVACLLILARAAVHKKHNITIGYLTAILGEMRDRQGLTISGAMTLALNELNNSTEILPDVNILMKWHDTRSDILISTQHLMNMSKDGVVAFFGPEGNCYTGAVVAQLRNLPMFSYKCAENDATTLSNFVSMEASNYKAMKSVISLLRYYQWSWFIILHEESWKSEARVLENYAKKNNMTVNDIYEISDYATTCSSEYWYQNIVRHTYDRTRVYVFLGSTSGLLNIMSAMESQQLFTKGEHMVIYVDMMSYSPQFALKYLEEPVYYMSYPCPNITEDFTNRARSLLVVASSELPSNYEQFANQVRKYDEEEPFNFPRAIPQKKFISIHAAHLYDSVKMYATALDDLIKEDTQDKDLSFAHLMDIATNGSRIVSRVIKRSPYESVSGVPIKLDEDAVSEGDFSVLAFKPARLQGEKIKCSHTMIPVGHFQLTDQEFPVYNPNPRISIDWANGVKPEDQPAGGFVKRPEDDPNFWPNGWWTQ